MICDYCNSEMFIDEWNGWVWTCINCGYDELQATDEEIREYEKEIMDLRRYSRVQPKGDISRPKEDVWAFCRKRFLQVN